MFFFTDSQYNFLIKSSLTITIKQSDRNSDRLVYLTDTGPIELRFRKDDVQHVKDDFNLTFSQLIKQLDNGLEYDELTNVLLDQYESLALSGHAALKSIFGPTGIKYLNHRLESIDTDAPPIIIINTDVVHIPWECLFIQNPLELQDGNLSVEEVVNKFWGRLFILARCEYSSMYSHNKLVDCLTEQNIIKPIVIGVAIDKSLNFSYLERIFFETIKKDEKNQINVPFFETESNLIAEFIEFLRRKDIKLLHIACHSEANPDYPQKSYLRLSENLRLLVQHLKLTTDLLEEAHFVFLNACSTGRNTPLGTVDFVSVFQENGVNNLIVTENMVESQVAEELATHFYEQFLIHRKPLGEALHIARKFVLASKEAKNIVSLFYSLYGNPFLCCLTNINENGDETNG